jgi:putative inorganic carbon (hco3(-)) transporter
VTVVHRMTATSPPLARHPAARAREAVVPHERTLLDWVVVAAGLAMAAGWAVQQPVLSLAAVGVMVLILAAARFDYFVLFLLVARSALDATKGGSGALSPTTALGAVFIVTVVVRELLIRSGGRTGPQLRSPVREPLIALLAVATLSGVLSDAPIPSLVECVRLAGVVAMVMALERMLVEDGMAPKVLVAVFLSAVLPIGLGLYQLVLGRGRLIADFSRVQGTFTHPNPFSIYLAIMIVLAVALFRHVRLSARLGLALVIGLGGVLLVATFTRGSWIALVLGLVVVGVLQNRLILGALVVAVAGVLVFVPSVTARFKDLFGPSRTASGASGNSLVWRVQHWQESLDLARDSPVFGIGLKGIERSTVGGQNAHNDLVRVIVETGLAGLLMYVLLVASLVWAARRALQTAPAGWRRGLAVGYAGVLAVLGVTSLSSNIITQVVLLWYVAAITTTVVAVSPTVAAPQGRRRVSRDGTVGPLPERVGPARRVHDRHPSAAASGDRGHPAAGAERPGRADAGRRPRRPERDAAGQDEGEGTGPAAEASHRRAAPGQEPGPGPWSPAGTGQRSSTAREGRAVEIVDLIRAAGRMAWIVLLFPLLAAGGAVAYQRTLPAEYSSTATLGLYVKSTGGAPQYGRDFAAAVRTTAVVEAAAKASGVPVGEVRDGLSARPVSDSSYTMQVSWTGPNRHADDIAFEVAKAGYVSTAGPSYRRALAAKKTADQPVADIQAQMDKISVTPPPDPKAESNAAATELSKAKSALDRATTAQDKKDAQGRVDAAEQRVKDAATAKDNYSTWNSLKNQLKTAAETARKVETPVDPAEELKEKGAVTAGSVTKASPSRALARAGAGGAVVGLIAAVLVLVLLQTMAGNRRARKARQQAARQGGGQPRNGQPRNGQPVNGRAAAQAQPAGRGHGRHQPAQDVDSLPWIFGDDQQQSSRSRY